MEGTIQDGPGLCIDNLSGIMMNGVEQQRQLLLITHGNAIYKFTSHMIPACGAHSLAVKGKKSLWCIAVTFSLGEKLPRPDVNSSGRDFVCCHI